MCKAVRVYLAVAFGGGGRLGWAMAGKAAAL